MPMKAAIPAGGSAAVRIRRYSILRMKIADAKKEAALISKAMLRPAMAVTSPPSDAPIASIADHIALDNAFAGINSSAVVKLGMIAVRAGSKNADAHTVSAITTYAIHT